MSRRARCRMNARPEIECHVCGGTGTMEYYDQRDPDGMVSACENCDGTGIEPPRYAGERDTGEKRTWHNGIGFEPGGFGDILEVLAVARRRACEPVDALPDDSAGLIELRKERRIENYRAFRRCAMASKVMQLAQADMLAAATRCESASARAVKAWRAAA